MSGFVGCLFEEKKARGWASRCGFVMVHFGSYTREIQHYLPSSILGGCIAEIRFWLHCLTGATQDLAPRDKPPSPRANLQHILEEFYRLFPESAKELSLYTSGDRRSKITERASTCVAGRSFKTCSFAPN